MTNTKTCPVCGKTLADSRVAKYPSARTCGVPACGKEYRRVRLNFHRSKYVKNRLRTDPAFRELKNQRQRNQYARERLLLRKIAAQREPLAPARGAIGTFLATLLQSASGALRRAAMAFQG